MTQTLTITKARAELPKIIDRASRKMDNYTITVNGIPSVMLISIAEYESMQETNEILSNPKLMKELKQAEKDMDEGKGIPWEQALKELGWK